jgi:DNA-binding transcriptional regulator LsrR (DeoR family)
MSRLIEMRLMAKVAKMYYDQRLQQSTIADRLDLSQATISRLIKRAQKENIVRTTVSIPVGVHTDIEEALQDTYKLKEAFVVDVLDNTEAEILRGIGAAAAYYLETTVRSGDVIGISSWSSTLLAMVDAMHQFNRIKNINVVQILGSVGNPAAEVHASNLLKRMAALLNGQAFFLPAAAVADSTSTKESYLKDQFVNQAMNMFEKVNISLVGIGAIEPSRLLASSGNIFAEDELNDLQVKGAVGDICLRFFNKNGQPVKSQLNERVIGMPLQMISKSDRSVGLAGGERKLKAIRGALRGNHINVLITDYFTARQLI